MSKSIIMFLLWSCSPDMSPHLLSVLTSFTPDTTVPSPPSFCLIPCVCQIKRPKLVWFSHVSAPCLHPPLEGMRSGSKCSVSCKCRDSLFFPHFFPYLHIYVRPFPFDVAVTSHECFQHLQWTAPALIILRQKPTSKTVVGFQTVKWALCYFELAKNPLHFDSNEKKKKA